jgi:hypothetical protein
VDKNKKTDLDSSRDPAIMSLSAPVVSYPYPSPLIRFGASIMGVTEGAVDGTVFHLEPIRKVNTVVKRNKYIHLRPFNAVTWCNCCNGSA